MEGRGLISIWFFIGMLLLVYGLIILFSALFVTPDHQTVLAHLRADLWWGILMTVIGGAYTYLFRPRPRQ